MEDAVIAQQRQRNVDAMLSALPVSLGFRRCWRGQDPFELRSENCVIRFHFERCESSSCIIEILHPLDTKPPMHSLLLQYLRSVKMPESNFATWFADYGRMLATYFGDVLSGDFSIRSQYAAVETRFWDRLFDIERLPVDHPTRILCDNYDLRWLDEIERDRE